MSQDLDAVEKQIQELREQFSDDVRFVVREALRIEQEKLHFVQPHGVVDEVLKMVKKRIEKKARD